MAINVILYRDTGGGAIPIQRFDQAIRGIETVEKTLRHTPGFASFGYNIFEPGFDLEPVGSNSLNAITDNSVRTPETGRAELSIAITTRQLFARILRPQFVGDLAQLYRETAVLTSYSAGAMILSTHDLTTGGLESPEDFIAQAAHGGFDLVARAGHCAIRNCLGHESIETHKTLTSFAPKNSDKSKHRTRPVRSFCSASRQLLKSNFETFADDAFTRRATALREDLPEPQ